MEYRSKCNVCGRIFCYTDKDIKNSNTAALLSAISDFGAAAGAVSGNWGATVVNQNNAQRNEKGIKDFSKCPYCNSDNITLLTDEEWEQEQKRQAINAKGGITINANASEENLIKRIENFIDDGDWVSAEIYAQQVLDMNPENEIGRAHD